MKGRLATVIVLVAVNLGIAMATTTRAEADARSIGQFTVFCISYALALPAIAVGIAALITRNKKTSLNVAIFSLLIMFGVLLNSALR